MEGDFGRQATRHQK